MKLISTKLIEEIESAKSRLDDSKISNFIQEIFKTLEKDVAENASVLDRDNETRGVEIVENFKDAWKYGQDGPCGNFDLLHLTEIAGRVEPILRAPGQTYASFRTSGATLQNICRAPADKERIMTHLNRMVRGLETTNIHPIEKAVYLYFHLMRIQPFENGNKRTANIIMNTSLKDDGFLPITTTPNERGVFLDYFCGAIEGFRDVGATGMLGELEPYVSPDNAQKQFYDFLARKELGLLACAENKMAGLHHYSIELPRGNPGNDYSLKHQIEKYFTARSIPGQVRLNETKKTLTVTGDIPQKTLEEIIKKSSLDKKIKIMH